MKFTTRYYGPPYDADGERGEDTTVPLRQAKDTLHPGQRMDCFRLRDEAQTTPVRMFLCDTLGQVEEIEM